MDSVFSQTCWETGTRQVYLTLFIPEDSPNNIHQRFFEMTVRKLEEKRCETPFT